MDWALWYKQSLPKLVGISQTPSLDLKLLIAFVSKRDPAELFGKSWGKVNDIDWVENLLQARINGKPVAKIIGKKSFWLNDFKTNEYTLDPRPSTETIIELVLKLFDSQASLKFLELGVGSGCLILSLLQLLVNSKALGVDISQEALGVAKENAENLGINRVDWLLSDWFSAIPEQKFDFIVSNPPYIPTAELGLLGSADFDPILALDGGFDGLRDYKIIINNVRRFIVPKGKIFLEFGYHFQIAALQKIAEEAELTYSFFCDLAGSPRVLVLEA